MFSRFLILVACVLAFSCQVLGPEEDKSGRLEVHLQSSFDHTPVQVMLDSKVIFDSLATTNHIIGLAGGVTVQTATGAHILEIIVDGTHQVTQEIILGPVLYAGVSYHQDEEVSLRLSKSRFYYF